LDNRSKKREYLKKGVVEHIVFGHTDGKLNYTNEINKLLSMELIQRIFIEKN